MIRTIHINIAYLGTVKPSTHIAIHRYILMCSHMEFSHTSLSLSASRSIYTGGMVADTEVSYKFELCGIRMQG